MERTETPRRDPLIGVRLADRYLIESVLGRGGMGVVYSARQEHMDRLVAIKMLHSHLVSDAEAIKRFHQEARAVSRLNHAHTVHLYEFGVEGQPYLVMEFIEGSNLRKLMQAEGPLPLDRALEIFMQVVDALSHAHTSGVIHRDLKPENIMLAEKGGKSDWVKVVDFGISQIASSTSQSYRSTDGHQAQKGEARGSPPYMSPEQCAASPNIDQRSDVYSLAIVFYEVLAGKLPYPAKSALEFMDCHMSQPAIPLSTAHPGLATCEALTAFLNKAMEKRPEKRHTTIDEFGSELVDAAKKDQVSLRSLKHRREVLDSGVRGLSVEDQAALATALKTGKPPPPPPVTPTDGLRSTNQESKPSKAMALGSAVEKILGTPVQSHPVVDPADADSKYAFLNCPHCGDQVARDLAFCLSCGRSLASTENFSKMRAAQGIFTLPKSQEAAAAPSFSSRTKSGRMEVGMPRHLRLLLVLSIVLVVLMVLVFTGGMNNLGRLVEHLMQTVQSEDPAPQ